MEVDAHVRGQADLARSHVQGCSAYVVKAAQGRSEAGVGAALGRVRPQRSGYQVPGHRSLAAQRDERQQSLRTEGELHLPVIDQQGEAAQYDEMRDFGLYAGRTTRTARPGHD
jgi:hypothetical protein